METPTLSNLTDPNYGKPVKEQNPLIQQLGLPHVSSFNYMITNGLNSAVRALDPVEFTLKEDRYTFIVDDAHLSCPLAPKGTIGLKDNRIKPSECRQRATTYKGKLTAKVTWKKNGRVEGAFEKDMGNVPIMLKSKCCHLDYMSPKELVKNGEHEQEWGGYFIVKGHERLIRMLMMTRRNYPIAIKRSGWKGRGELFSDLGVTMRCVANDQTSTTNVLHYVTDGTAKLMFSNRRNLFYVPLVLLLKCLLDTSDLIMYQKLVRGYENDTWYINCIQNMLRSLHEEGLHTHHACKSYLGKMFRPKYYQCPEWFTDIEVANYVIRRSILIHLDKPEDKFNILAFMTQKLFVAAQDKCTVEGADSVMMQELLLGGHLYLQIIKEKLQLWLYNMKTTILKYASSKSGFVFSQAEITTAAKRCGGLENAMEHFLSTGSITSPSGLGLMQDKGLTIVAENINRMRYMSHFRAVHRGAFFQEMRTTEVRQLLPDAWGFICPVHTPDGAPCGLLNHLTTSCTVTDVPDAQKVKNIKLCLAEMGMEPINHVTKLDVTSTYTVLLDGQVLGYIRANMMDKIVNKLRKYKVEGEKVPNMLEIVWVPIKTSRSQFPGLFLFTGPARMMRPVFSAVHQTEEFIGSFEQVYMEICVKADKAYPGLTTHVELSQTEILSNLAKLIPMPDCNQSPRNMYQCQMGKQTMGTPCHNWGWQAETKLYRLQTPASPFFRPVHYDNLGMDDFAMGTNAIVAVVSFTGYDMEDAMMINKMSEERGLAHGSIYKSQFIELEHPTSHFSMDPDRPELAQFLDSDGLPYHGRKMQDDEPLYCFYSVDESKYVVRNFTSKEECYVDNIRLCGDFDSRAKQIACITFRVPRNPTVGDKFASRAGQKGILSMRWPMENLPFTETGMVPDIVFNPHGFPSRMTIAMIIEIMAGKSAAIHGMVHDATPFKFSENQSAAEYFEKLLEKAGYNAHGLETMYSGIDGSEMSAQIFTGIVHYQRLRHMVSDKWQVRSTGPIDILTRQPLKGRKRGGGVRFGEMERDCLISHGSSFLLEDRLFHNSDKYRAYICTACGSILSSLTMLLRPGDKPHLEETMEKCTLCDSGKDIAEVEIPYIFKHFVTQLASCNITVKIGCKTV